MENRPKWCIHYAPGFFKTPKDCEPTRKQWEQVTGLKTSMSWDPTSDGWIVLFDEKNPIDRDTSALELYLNTLLLGC